LERRRRQKHSTSIYSWSNKPVLLRSIEPSQYTSWAFGRRLRAAGLLGSMGSIGDAYDNSMAESFFGTLQMELLDRQRWATRHELALAMFEYIEAFYNRTRRHSSIGNVSPVEFESRHTAASVAA
jgi:putative transposase